MTENPYTVAPSGLEQDPEIAPESHGWTVHGKRLLISAGAVLPMVDPFSGRMDDRMTLLAMKVQRRPRWLRDLLIVSLSLLMLAATDTLPDEIALVFWGLGIVGVLVRLFVGNFYKSVTVRVFVSDSTLAKSQLVRALNIGFLVCIVVLLFSEHLKINERVFPAMTQCLLFVTFAIRLIAIVLQREILFNGRTAGGLMRITGLHPKALREMEKLLPDERKMPKAKAKRSL